MDLDTLLISAQTLFAADYVTFYHNDHVGTPLAISDSTGSVVWQADYKPFGEEHTVTGTAENKRRFVGKEKDTESGLSYFDVRYEDAKTGRFISVDPVGAVNPQNSKTNEELLGNPQKLNSYAYGLNNPYRFVDVDGKNPVLIGLGIIWLGEMMKPQTMGSSQRDSFLDRHSVDLVMLPLGIEREGAMLASKITSSEVSVLYNAKINTKIYAQLEKQFEKMALKQFIKHLEKLKGPFRNTRISYLA